MTQQPPSTYKAYLPNLDGLRLIAALMVWLHHTEIVRQIFGLPHLANLPSVAAMGKTGVILFFVISGFLITHLLLQEKQQAKTIAVGNFYLRRILRIWPLYFLIIGIALLIAPQTALLQLPNFETALNSQTIRPILLLFIFILPNMVYVHYGIVPYAAQTWSIGTEEQFYLLWP